jgi:hypothetical protein
VQYSVNGILSVSWADPKSRFAQVFPRFQRFRPLVLKPNATLDANLIRSIRSKMDDNRVRTRPPGFLLIPETATFLNLCVAACCGWVFLRLVGKVKGGATKELDEKILRMLRQRDNPTLPRGPKWLPQASQDITSLGSGTNLTIASSIAVGFLCLQRRFRAAGFLIVSLGSGLSFATC